MAKDSLTALADAVASDTPVDWADAESSAVDAAELEEIRQLRAIAALGSAARNLTPRWGPFELRGEIGRGAFGTVYRAWDPRLGREVALKLLHANPDALDTGGVIAEARMLAGVEHPNIVPVYGADVHDGRVGIWMKLVNGKTLKEILVEQGPFGAEEAAQIGRALCRALAAVHRKGFVHRDIKAQNVMREVGGEILLMDFGAGDLISDGPASTLRGSPAYLAPEVLAGGPPTVQSDIYSLGVLLFHLVSGTFPVTDRDLQGQRATHSAGRRRLLRDERPNLPASFLSAVEGALAPLPSDRPISAGQMDESLTGQTWSGAPAKSSRTRIWRVIAVAVAVFVSLPLLNRVVSQQPPAALGVATLSQRKPIRIGVLPLKDLTGDPAKAFAAAGLTELLITHLARLPGVSVPSSSSTAALSLAPNPSIQVAQALGVDLLLVGAVAQAGGRLHVSVRLVDPSKDSTLWGDEVIRLSESILTAASQIAQSVANKLAVSRSPTQKPYVARDPEVEEAFVRGLADINSSLDSRLPSAVAQFTRAVELDASFADGWAHLALAEQRHIELKNPADRDVLAVGVREKAQRALSLDASSPAAHVAIGVIQFHHDWDFEAAEESFRRAIDIVPGDAYARTRYAWLLAAEARHQEAIDQAEAARSLEPLVATHYTTLGMIRYYARDFAGALIELQRALELSPGFPLAHLCIARVLLATGDAHGALQAAERALERGRNPGWLWVLAQAQVLAERRLQAGQTVAEIDALEASGRYASIDNRAYYALGLKRYDDALPYLREAVSRRMTNVLWLKVDPRVDPLRGRPPFDALVSSMQKR